MHTHTHMQGTCTQYISGYNKHLFHTTALNPWTGGGRAVFFDLSKVFDSVPHHHLLNKLGLNPFITKWIESYLDLSGRLQLVVLDDVES